MALLGLFFPDTSTANTVIMVSTYSDEWGTIIISVLQMKKLRPRKGNRLAPGHTERDMVEKGFKPKSVQSESICWAHDAKSPLALWDRVHRVWVWITRTAEGHGQHQMDCFPETVYVLALAVLLDISSTESPAN